jgi:hypothetical protein
MCTFRVQLNLTSVLLLFEILECTDDKITVQALCLTLLLLFLLLLLLLFCRSKNIVYVSFQG